MDISPSMSICRAIIAVIVTSALLCYAAVDVEKPAPTATHRSAAPVYADLLDQHQAGDREVLRMRTDRDRHRLWVLTVENVYVYDTTARTLLRRIRLPQWSVADFGEMCPPDLALDKSGAAFVSNNVQPRLFQIEPSSFGTKEHELKLVSGKQWDIGFGSLQFAPDGTLFAESALAGSIFRIDLAAGNAIEVGSVRMARSCAVGD